MNQIISPWIFYLLDLVETVNRLATVAFVIAPFVMFGSYTDGNKRIFKWATSVFCVCLVLIIFIPTKQTAYTMLIAQYATTENIEKLGGATEKTVQKLADIIVDAAKKIEKE